MSSVTSNANLSDFNVYNTVVNESAVAAVLGPLNLDNLLFASACNPEDPITVTSADPVLTLGNYIQALIGQQIVIAGGSAGDLVVGADTAANAKALQDIFGLTAANPSRILSFVAFATTTGAAAGANFQINLANSSGTATYVKIQDWAASAAAATYALYDATKAANGVVKRVQVYATVFTAGSEVVWFRILQSSA